MRDFRDLKVWQKAHSLVLDVYRYSRGFPTDERFGLTSHLRKSAISIPSNIAAGSASETQYQILLAYDLSYLKNEEYEHLNALVTEVKRMLYSLHQKVSAKKPKADSR